MNNCEIYLTDGSTIKGRLDYYGHSHPKDEPGEEERKNWHYYKNIDTGVIYHIRAERIVYVKEWE